jgi:hypothetical protein
VTALREANHALTREFFRSVREGDGCPLEADDAVNDASRAVVAAMRDELGAAWIGRVNRSREERENPDHPVIWEYEGGMVYNFGADFVVPAFDAELVRLIVEYNSGPWHAATKAKQVQAVTDRVRSLGGVTLVWT